VVDGALWFEESLPPETIFYFPVVANAAREKNKKIAASDIMDSFKSLFTTTPYLQVGGNETTGMGWCRVHTYEGESR